MFKLPAFLFALFALSTHATSIIYNNTEYKVEKLGAKYIVYQPHMEMNGEDISRFAKNNCENLATYFAKRDQFFKACEEDIESTMCKILRENLVFTSKEENYQVPYSVIPLRREWRLTRATPSPRADDLKRYVATQLSVDEFDVLIQTNSWPTTPHQPFIVPTSESMIFRASMVTPIGPNLLEPFRRSRDSLTTNNRFLACDLANHAIKVRGLYTTKIGYQDSTHPKTVEAIWDLYQDLHFLFHYDASQQPPLVKTARLARQIAMLTPMISLDVRDEFTRLFDDLVLVNEWTLELKSFASAQELHDKQYPTQEFSKDVDVMWSLQ